MTDPKQVRVVKALAKPRTGLGLFAMMRDEAYLLPRFFEHYRRLGVSTFVIYDDRSGPEALDYLMAQPDAVILQSGLRYEELLATETAGETRLARTLMKERLPDAFLPNQWAVLVDADEFMILPSGFADLPAFIDHLDQIGQPYATAPMVDFYGETLNARNYPADLDPFAGNPFFDAGPYYYWIGQPAPKSFGRGVRTRLLKRLCERRPDKVLPLYNDTAPGPAQQWKTPLLKHGAGLRRVGEHIISTAPRPEDAAVALAHFKFCPDLDAKIEVALRERQHYGGSVEYAFLNAAIQFFGGEPLACDETRRFEGPKSLEEAGLLRPSSPKPKA